MQDYFWYSFLLEAEPNPRAIVRLEGLATLKKKTKDLVGNRTRDLPACIYIFHIYIYSK
jgi:hypothetical protein